MHKFIRELNSQFGYFILISNKFRLDQSVENWILHKRISMFPTQNEHFEYIFAREFFFWNGIGYSLSASSGLSPSI